MTDDLDPYGGVFKWARRRAAQHRAKFGVSAVVFTAAAVLVGAFIAPSGHPTVQERVMSGLIALVLAAVAVLAVTFVYAVLLAPYEQRRMLRTRLTAVTAIIESRRPSLLIDAEPINIERAGFAGPHRQPGGSLEVLWRFALYVLNRSAVAPVSLRFEGEVILRNGDREVTLHSIWDRFPQTSGDLRMIQRVERIEPTHHIRGAAFFSATVEDHTLVTAGDWAFGEAKLHIIEELSGLTLTIPVPGRGEVGDASVG